MQDSPRESENLLANPVTDRDHALGPATASITIVEYGDYECSSCLNAVPIVHEIRRQLGDRLRFVFRHFRKARFTRAPASPPKPPPVS
jgi:hypothetical protein